MGVFNKKKRNLKKKEESGERQEIKSSSRVPELKAKPSHSCDIMESFQMIALKAHKYCSVEKPDTGTL